MTAKIELPAKLTSSRGDDLIRMLHQTEDGAMQIDGGQVEMIGGRCAEILARFVLETRAAGGRLAIERPTQAMWNDLRLLGLAEAVLGAGPAQ